MRSQITKHGHRHFFCYSCLHGFRREDCTRLKEHEKHCLKQQAQRTLMPKDTVFEFTNIHKQLAAPFIVYADFECILKQTADINTTTGVVTESTTAVKYQEHEPCSFAYKVVSIDPDFRLTPI